MSAVDVRSILAESESLLRAVDSTEGSYLDAKADALGSASLAVKELIEADRDYDKAKVAMYAAYPKAKYAEAAKRFEAANARRMAALAAVGGAA